MKKYFFKNKLLFTGNIILTLAESILSVMLAFILANFVDAAVEYDMALLYKTCIIFSLYLISVLIVWYSLRIVRASYIRQMLFDLKNDIFSKVINKEIDQFQKGNSASYISTLNNDITILEQDYFKNILTMVALIFSFIIATVAIFKLNFFIAVGVFVISIFLVAIPYLFREKISRAKREFSDSLSDLTVQTNEILSGFEVVKSFNVEKLVDEQYKKYNKKVEDNRFFFEKMLALANSLTEFFGYLMFFASLGLGAYLVIKRILEPGLMIAAVQLMNNIVNPMIGIIERVNALKGTESIQKKIMDIMEDKEQQEGEFISKTDFNDAIVFENVSFSYGKREEPTLKNISFTVKKGEKCAIIGPNGSGKSTIVKLLLKYYNNFEGRILIDGIDIRNIKTEDLYNNLISVIHQNVFMFDTSIKNNITLFKEYDEKVIERAISLSGLKEFIEKLPDKENTEVGEKGSNLSGGERQRISIARALIKGTPILVSDEPTSSLDKKTALSIENSILSIEGLTALVITHNTSEEVLKKYDKIIFVEDGEIVKVGAFDEIFTPASVVLSVVG
ncbi:ABC transporter ATP-binding protein [Caldanaerobacter subterraneus]|uniref:ABC transporter ATP-binding protein n=1 Tax=Caldanaerobacter subterraneus TaxID=911092 RepID=A0A7Y2L892_9THEO|nr:ABC transporter ATP-binding protein [Caldanaerobacter subterraneus]NNG67633.1 ABC transporter ATP-binding protein [Caldanaerobacter subterraneus]